MRKTIITTLLEREKADPTVDVDVISNDNTDETLADPILEGENAVVDFASKTIGEVHVTKTYTISQVTPMTIMTTKSPDGKDIASLVLLCKDQYSDFTFCLTHNYIIENEEQKKQVEKNPIHDNVNYISKRLATNMVLRTLPVYITDLNFYYDKNYENPNEQFYMFAVPNKEENTRQIVKFNMSAEIFSVLAFLDDYIVSDSHNIHDLQIATIAGYKQADMLVTVNFVDNIDSIISLAPADEKNSTDVAVVFKTIEFVDANTKAIYKILTAFNFGKKYPKKKFRGATLAKLEDEYGKDVDQYVSNYMIECRLKNLDKDYLIIKAKNKDGVCKLFFIDNDNQKIIEELIEMY